MSRPGRVSRSLSVVLAAAFLGVLCSPVGTARADPLVDRRELLGTSVNGRPIRAFELGDPSAPVTVFRLVAPRR